MSVFSLNPGSNGLGLLADRFDAGRVSTGGNSGAEHRAFENVLGVARGFDPDETMAGREARAREGAEKLVASVFLEPLLKSVRESNQAAPPFAPTRGEKQFRGLLDARVAEAVVHRSDMPLVKRIAEDLLRAGGGFEKKTGGLS